jgi:hypothetical protein
LAVKCELRAVTGGDMETSYVAALVVAGIVALGALIVYRDRLTDFALSLGPSKLRLRASGPPRSRVLRSDTSSSNEPKDGVLGIVRGLSIFLSVLLLNVIRLPANVGIRVFKSILVGNKIEIRGASSDEGKIDE